MCSISGLITGTREEWNVHTAAIITEGATRRDSALEAESPKRLAQDHAFLLGMTQWWLGHSREDTAAACQQISKPIRPHQSRDTFHIRHLSFSMTMQCNYADGTGGKHTKLVVWFATYTWL